MIGMFLYDRTHERAATEVEMNKHYYAIYTRVFIDVSSAYNIIQRHLIISKLLHLHISHFFSH